MIVKIVRYFNYPNIKRQTPDNSFKWKDIIFTEEDIDECDYLVILEYPKNDFSVKVNKENILHLCQEPPSEISKYRQYSNKKVSKIFNQIDTKSNNILSHGALPWHIDKDYDFLNKLNRDFLQKKNEIVWVTSNQQSSKGHKKRMGFLNEIKDLPYVNLYGRGIKPIEDKWDALSKYKYAIAYENYKNDYYWTEKIIDCYLSYTMPIYYGCNNIDNYFPKDSFIQLDPNDKHIKLYLEEVLKSKKWENNITFIEEARNLVLNKYQLFPFIYDQIQFFEGNKNEKLDKENISFKGGDAFYDNFPVKVKLEKNISKLYRKLFS